MNKTGQEVKHHQLIDENYIICKTPVKTSTRTVTFKYVALVKVCVLLSQVTKRPVETLADAKLYAGHNLLFISSEESGDELFIQLLQQGE